MFRKPLLVLAMLTGISTKPAAALFLRLAAGWELCPSRRTLTNVYRFAGPGYNTKVDATHCFFRDGAWTLSSLWEKWARPLVSLLAPNDPVLTLTLDDTAHHKTGPRINGARACRDAVRSIRNKTAYCWALPFAPLCLLVRPPWGGEPLSLPLNLRLNRKAKKGEAKATLIDHAKNMMRERAQWLPGKRFRLICDGAYAPWIGCNLPRAEIIARIRSDAAIYDLPPPRLPGQRGRPRVKGGRLPTPKGLAEQASEWKLEETEERRGRRGG